MNRDEALKILTNVAPALGKGVGLLLHPLVKQAADLIASEAIRTSEGPLKDSKGYVEPPRVLTRTPAEYGALHEQLNRERIAEEKTAGKLMGSDADSVRS